MAENKQDIAYLNDIKDVATTPASAVQGNVPVFGANHALVDSGKKPADFIEQAELDAAVQTATAEIWNAVNSTYAIAAYSASTWKTSTEYEVGDYCRVGSLGYRCTVDHTSGAIFDPTKWRLVLTSAGKLAIDALLADIPTQGIAALIDLAPQYSGSTDYVIGQMAVKDSVLQICTAAGRGPAAVFSRDATVEKSIAQRLLAIPTKVSDLTNDAKYVASSAIDSEYDTTSHGYAVGDTCTHEAKFYVCTQVVAQGSAWNAANWNERTFRQIVSSLVIQTHPDWEEDDPNDPAYIKNKPDIPEIDETLSIEGAAADAKAVGDALAGIVTADNLNYKIVAVLPGTPTEPTQIPFQLVNRAINVITTPVESGKSILLIPPAQPSSTTSGVILSRDFYVLLSLTSVSETTVSVQRSSLINANGGSVALKIKANGTAVFRLTDSDRNNSVFLVSGFGDAAHSAIVEIEQALDDILKDGGSGVYTLGFYLPDEDGKYHEVKIVTDSETGEKNLGVEQEGITK